MAPPFDEKVADWRVADWVLRACHSFRIGPHCNYIHSTYGLMYVGTAEYLSARLAPFAVFRHLEMLVQYSINDIYYVVLWSLYECSADPNCRIHYGEWSRLYGASSICRILIALVSFVVACLSLSGAAVSSGLTRGTSIHTYAPM